MTKCLTSVVGILPTLVLVKQKLSPTSRPFVIMGLGLGPQLSIIIIIICDLFSISVAYQRMSWEALKKSINGLINKVY